MKAIKKSIGVLIFSSTILFSICLSAQDYVPTSENLEARKWFQEAKFGLFVHWGVYSLLGDGEWVMNNQNIAIDEYEKLPTFFNPIDFDPEAKKFVKVKWISLLCIHNRLENPIGE